MRAWIAWATLLVLAPLLPGVAAKTVAVLTGRRGAPLLQPYRDLARLWGKGVVYSTVTTWISRTAPWVWAGSALLGAALLPLDGRAGIVGFGGDWALLAGLLALGRFALTLCALDTGSSFEGMGASREITITSFAEPVLFVVFVVLALATGGESLSQLFGASIPGAWSRFGATLVMASASLFLLTLAEAARGPIDDPSTHLELTMIHEVMILDQSGPDLAILLFGSALRFAVFAALVLGIVWPAESLPTAMIPARLLIGIAAIGLLVGLVEATMARIRLVRVPQFLFSAGVLAALGAMLTFR